MVRWPASSDVRRIPMAIPRALRTPLPLVVVAGLALVVAGIWRADRALVRGERDRVELEAQQSASLVQTFLALHAQALAGLSGLYPAGRGIPDSEQFHELAALIGERAPGFRRLWVSDERGRVLLDAPLAPGAGPLPPLALDTIRDLWATAARARATRRTQLTGIGPLLSGDSGFVLIEPVRPGGRFRGFAGGSVPARALLDAVPRRLSDGRVLSIVLRSTRGDTIVADLRAGLAGARATSPVRLPGGDGSWELAIVDPATGQWERVALWGTALGMLLALTIWLLHERRQAWRMRTRTAELERLSTELLRANKSKSEFLANVSHELRTPLNAIVGFTDLLRDGVYGELNPRQAGPVQRIEASATHLRHLVDQILDLAKMAAGRLEVHPELLDLRPFVLDVATEVEPLVNEKGLALSLTIPATLPRVRTDPTHLRQILVNLIGNAVKYTTAGTVTVRARLVGAGDDGASSGVRMARGFEVGAPPRSGPRNPTGLWVAAQVVDTGIGIAREDQERIFEEFEQVGVGARGDSMQRGTGLGLPISRRLARLIGGDVTLDSSRPGEGSVFTLWLPVNPADVRPVTDTGRVAAVPAGASGRAG